MDIGSEIKKLRESKGLKQKTVAEMLHMSAGNLSRIEKDASGASYETIYNIYSTLEEIDPITLKIAARNHSFSPSMERLVAKMRLLTFEEQEALTKAQEPLIDCLLDYSNKNKEK